MSLDREGVVLFHTMTALFQLERELRAARMPVGLMPTPRKLSSDCGSALRFPWTHEQIVRDTIAELHLDVQGIHELEQ